MRVDLREAHRRAMTGIVAGVYRRFCNNHDAYMSPVLRIEIYHQKKAAAPK